MVLFASMIINIGRRRQMAEFSEQILWRDGSKQSQLEDRWHKGVYLGPCLRSSDSLVGTAEGA
eukprot:2330114-Amphidinium_carterae.1